MDLYLHDARSSRLSRSAATGPLAPASLACFPWKFHPQCSVCQPPSRNTFNRSLFVDRRSWSRNLYTLQATEIESTSQHGSKGLSPRSPFSC